MDEENKKSQNLSQESFSELFVHDLSLPNSAISICDIIPGFESGDNSFPGCIPGLDDSEMRNAVIPHCRSYYEITYDSSSCQNVTSTTVENSNMVIRPTQSLPMITFAKLTKPELQHLRQVPLLSSNWAGEHNFDVSICPPEGQSKSSNWTYSEIRDKLYVKKDELCPISFTADPSIPCNSKIRALPVFTDSTQTSNIVHRCYDHSLTDAAKGVPFSDHLIHCVGSQVIYEEDFTGRRSVVLPYSTPPNGQNLSTYLLKFMCFGSCAGGLNRRPIKIIFTMENNNEVIGRRSIEVKICACPVRDCANDDKLDFKCPKMPKKLKRKSSDGSKILPKKLLTSESDNGEKFLIMTRSKEEYEFLKHCQMLYRMHNAFKSLSPEAMQFMKSLSCKIKKEKK